MGRRLRVHLAAADRGRSRDPLIVVAPIRALVQRLGPHVDRRRADRRASGADASIATRSSTDLVDLGTGANTRSRRAARSRCAGSIVDVYPVTADHPVRIDLWGDEVERLVGVLGRRPALHRTTSTRRSRSSRAASCSPPPTCRRAPARSCTEQPWGRGAMGAPRRGPVVRRHGVVAAVARAERAPAARPARPDALVAAASSRGACATARQDLLDEEAALAETLAVTWDARPATTAPAPVAAVRPAARAHAAGAVPVLATPETPDTPAVAATGVRPGRRRCRGARPIASRALRDRRLPRGARGRRHGGSADRLARRAGRRRRRRRLVAMPIARRCTPARSWSHRSNGARCCPARSSRSSPRPTSPAGAACTAAARRARRRPTTTTISKPGDYVVHHVHGVGRYVGMTPRTMAASSATTCSLEFRGDDKVYVPTDQVGHRAQVHRRRHADAQPHGRRRLREASGRRCAARCREIAEELVVLYRQRLATPGHAFAPDTPWQHEVEEAFPYEETPDQLQAIDEVKADMERADPDGPPGLRRRRVRQDRGRGARRVQGGAGRQAGGRARARPRCSRASTARPSASGSPTTRCGSRCCRGSSPPKEQNAVVARPRDRARSTW